MADRYLLESGSPDGYLLEDSSGVLLLEAFEFANSAEGGTDGVTVTNANSGGASGDAFDTEMLTHGGGNSPTFEADAAITGTMGYKLPNTDPTGWLGWSTSMPAGLKTLYGRAYINIQSWNNVLYFILGEAAGGASFMAYLEFNVAAFNLNTNGAGDTGTILSTDTWYRLEWKLVSHASAGSVDVFVYAGHGTTPIDTLSVSGTNTGGADIQRVYFQNENGGGSQVVWVDDINTNSTGYPGPSGSDAVPGLSTRRRQPHVPMRDLDPWSTTGWRG